MWKICYTSVSDKQELTYSDDHVLAYAAYAPRPWSLLPLDLLSALWKVPLLNLPPYPFAEIEPFLSSEPSLFLKLSRCSRCAFRRSSRLSCFPAPACSPPPPLALANALFLSRSIAEVLRSLALLDTLLFLSSSFALAALPLAALDDDEDEELDDAPPATASGFFFGRPRPFFFSPSAGAAAAGAGSAAAGSSFF